MCVKLNHLSSQSDIYCFINTSTIQVPWYGHSVLTSSLFQPHHSLILCAGTGFWNQITLSTLFRILFIFSPGLLYSTPLVSLFLSDAYTPERFLEL